MTALGWVIAAVIYMAGLGFTYGAIEKLGSRNRGSSFSGDYLVDCLCCVLWPVLWLLWLPAQIGKKVF